jgi:hypothetical protein
MWQFYFKKQAVLIIPAGETKVTPGLFWVLIDIDHFLPFGKAV